MMRRIIISALLFMGYHFVHAQATHNVDLVTGTLNVGLPLFSIQDGGVSVPIALNYSGSGVRVTDDDGWTGHGWGVSVESFRISRDVRGLPDEYNVPGDPRVGWLHDANSTLRTQIQNFVINTDNNPATCADEVANYNFLNGIDHNKDTEPDVFYVNAPGISFQFYFDENKVPRVVPFQHVIVEWSSSSNTFIVTSDKGVKYEFTERETISEEVYETSAFYFVRKTNQHVNMLSYTTSWRLTKIESPVYGTVNLTYRTITVGDNNLIAASGKYRNLMRYRYPLIISNTWMTNNVLAYTRSSTLKIPDKIISPNAEAWFISAPKSTFNIVERLNNIRLYDKREGTSTLVREFPLTYIFQTSEGRAFLSTVKEKTTNNELVHTFTYNNSFPTLPSYDSKKMDDWEYYKEPNPAASYQYDETAASGTLRTIHYPLKGYSAFFYETNQYREGGTDVHGAGIRIKKIISYDGVSSANDFEQEFEYRDESNNSSGKLTYKARKQFSVLRLSQFASLSGSQWYYQVQAAFPGLTTEQMKERFTVTGDADMGSPELMHGSYVAYSRVIVRTKDAGYSVYEYENPALEGDNSATSEWQRSQVLIARQGTGNSNCFQITNITGGYDHYPFPPNPNYEFARGLLRKVTDYRADGIKVRDVVYDYQRIYGGSAIRKVYGLAIEELPTYYYNGSTHVSGKMFLFSKYDNNTEVKTELLKTTETVYHSTDLSKKTIVTKDFFYTASNHRYLTRVETFNSDGVKSISRFKYVKDFSSITSPASVEAAALKDLNTAHRVGETVESSASKVVNGSEVYTGASLTTYSTLPPGTGLPDKVLPYKTYSFTSHGGDAGFTLSSSTTTAFVYASSKYVFEKEYLSFDSYGNATEVTGRSKDISSVVYGYGGTLPTLQVSHARLNNIRYNNFDQNGVEEPTGLFPTWTSPDWTYSTCPGRNGSTGINFPAGSASSNYFTGGITANKLGFLTIFSFWAKSSVNATVSIRFGSVTYTISVVPSAEYKYYSLQSPIENILGYPTSYPVTVWTSATIQLDDMALYPELVDFVSNTYDIPFGKTAETDSRANTMSYEYDDMGRLKVVYDRDRNIIKTYDYQIKP